MEEIYPENLSAITFTMFAFNNLLNNDNTNKSTIGKSGFNREALSPKNRSPIRTTITNNNNNRVKFDENKNNILNCEKNNLIKIRERSSHHAFTNSNNLNTSFHPIQTSYEAIQATLRNHELIIEYLNNIVLKIDNDLAKEANVEKCFSLLKEQRQSEIKGIKV